MCFVADASLGGLRCSQFTAHSWVTIRIDFIGTLFATSLSIYLTYISSLSAANIGFSLAMAGEHDEPCRY